MCLLLKVLYAYQIILIDKVCRNLFAYDFSKYCVTARPGSLRFLRFIRHVGADQTPICAAYGSVHRRRTLIGHKYASLCKYALIG